MNIQNCAVLTVVGLSVLLSSRVYAQIPDSTIVSLTGRVLYEGEPVPGADIYRIDQWYPGWTRAKDTTMRIAVSGPDGMFTFPAVMRDGKFEGAVHLAALAEGRMVGFFIFRRDVNPDSITVTMYSLLPISGIVRDTAGWPVPGAEVYAWSIFDYERGYGTTDLSGALPGTTTTTDSLGGFRLVTVPEGAKAGIEVSAKGFAASATEVTAGSDDAAIVLVPESRIAGKVVRSPTGKPVEGVTVIARGNNTDFGISDTKEAITGRNGEYMIEGIAPGMYYLYLIYRGGEPQVLAPPFMNVAVPLNGTKKNVDFRVVSGVPVSGRVTEQGTGDPLKGVYVNAWQIISDVSQSYDSVIRFQSGYAVTDSTGCYTLRVLPGEVELSARPPEGFYRDIQLRKLSIEDGKPLTDINLRLDRGIEARGTLLMPDGAPARDVGVSDGYQMHMKTDERGRFIISGLLQGHEYTFYAFSRDGAHNAVFTVKAEPGAEVTVTLHPQRFITVSGTVVGHDGAPASGIPVDLKLAGGLVSDYRKSAAVTDSNGAFTITDFPAEMTFRLSIRNDLAVSPNFKAVESAGPFRIVLPRADRWIEGRVLDGSGAPLPGVTVETWSERSGHRETKTDVEGRYRLDSLVGETEDITLRRYTYRAEFRDIPTNSRKDFTLFTGWEYLSGTVAGPGGKPVAGALIVIDRSETGRREVKVLTDGKGLFVAGGVFGNAVSITVSRDGYRTKKIQSQRTDRDGLKFVIEPE